MSPLRAVAGGVEVAVRLSPKASRAMVEGVRRDSAGNAYLAVRVSAPAEGGKANTALIKLLAKHWRLPPSRITLVAGARDRRKRLRVAGDPEALRAAIEGAFSRAAP